MLITLAGLAAIFAAAGATAVPRQAAAPAWRWSAETVVDQAVVSGVRISPDGSRIVCTVSRPRLADAAPGPQHADIWVLPFEGGWTRRMTFADAEHKDPAWSPDGALIAFLSNRGSGSATGLWLLPVSGGEAVRLTDEKVEVDRFAWSPDARRIAYVAADPVDEAKEAAIRSGRDWVVVDEDLRPRRLWIVDAAASGGGHAVPVASAGSRSCWQIAWSPDGREIAAACADTPRADDSYIGKRVMVFPADGGSAGARTVREASGKVDQVTWSPEGRTIALRAGVDRSDPYSGSLLLVPAAGGGASGPPAAVNLTGDRPESASDIAWIGGHRLGVVAVRGTKTALSVVDTSGRLSITDIAGPDRAVFTAASFSADGRRFALAASTPEGPAEVHAGSLRGRSPAGLRRVSSFNDSLERLPRGAQETFRYTARDGLEIEAVLVRPVSYPREGRYPMVVVAHGGPESQYLEGWHTGATTPVQALAERGYFVLMPNYRGSTGRGVAFAKADHLDLGGKEFDDVIDGIEAATARLPIDPARVGMMGGSYGGYLTALGLTRHSRRFAAAVDLFGITNWISYIGTTDIPAENSMVHWALWCHDHAATCRQASPIAHVLGAATPTLILQGEEDARVPKSQSDELYAALRWRQVPVQYVVFPREKHGFRERAHQIEAFNRIIGWFERYLKP